MNIKIILVFVFGVVLISCNNQPEQTADTDSGFIEISKAQFDSEKMKIGAPELYPFAAKVHFTGAIVPAVDGQAQISLPLPGIIENIRCKPAQMVRQGSVLFEISGHRFIELQEDFSESSAILSKLKSDYLRTKELYNENIATQKDFTAAESKYYVENAKHKALRAKFESMGLEVAKIEKGEFYSSYPINSPINGFVSSINASIGQYVDPQQTIVEIIDNNSFQLKLSVFEKDIHKIKPGQIVEFYFNGSKTQKQQATINVIGKTIMPQSMAVECYAAIDNPDGITMVSNQFVEGDIFTAVDSVLAVPETAIIPSEDETYVLMYEKEENSTFYFRKTKVNTGRKANNYIELTAQLPSAKLLVAGTYNIVIE